MKFRILAKVRLMGGPKAGAEVTQAVVELAWAALTKQQEKLKCAVAMERLETQKMRESLELYRKVVKELETHEPEEAVSSTSDQKVCPDVCTVGLSLPQLCCSWYH